MDSGRKSFLMGKLRWLVLKTTRLLKPVYRRLGFFPYPGSVIVQHKRDTKSWHDTERGKQAAASLYEQRHTPVNTALLIAATIVLTLLVDISPPKTHSGSPSTPSGSFTPPSSG
jgi:hypothetical protein